MMGGKSLRKISTGLVWCEQDVSGARELPGERLRYMLSVRRAYVPGELWVNP